MAISVTKSNTGAVNSTTRNVAFSAASAGDLLIAVIMADGAGTFTWAGTTTATELTDTVVGSNVARLAIAYRIATGGETNIDATCTASERSTHFGIRIPAAEWHGTTPPEIAVAASSSTNSPNPPSLTASWGSADNIWIAGFVTDSGGTTGYPTGYDDNRTVQAGADEASSGYGAMATKVATTATDDPSNFTITTTDDNVAYTIVVRPPAAGGGTTVTPGVASLTTARFAPTVSVSNHQTVVPGVASLTTSRFAPTVTASDHKTVVPGVASLSTSLFAPSVNIGVRVTPATASLATSRFAPTVAVSDNKVATIGVASLTTTRYAPTVATPRTVVPATAALTLTTFAPSVGTSVRVVPSTAALVLTTYAPLANIGLPTLQLILYHRE